jgi:hypothetical protein
MALVICTGVDQALLNTRRLILEGAGHTVVTVMDETGLRAACKMQSFDVAVIGQAVTPKMKRKVSSLLRENCPAVKVLELFDNRTGRVLDDADAWLMTPAEIPEDLADRVHELARRGKQKQQRA